MSHIKNVKPIITIITAIAVIIFKLCLCLIFASYLLLGAKVHAILGDFGSGWAQIPYLAQILTDNIKRYEQLKQVIESEENRDNYLRLIHEGIENSMGLMNSLPIKDEKILGHLREFNKAYSSVVKVYGKVPRSSEALMHTLHDQTVAESIKMVGGIDPYTQAQEKNAMSIARQIRRASPKGAVRMTVETNAKILHTLNQILKINGQLLKLQSESLAMENKHDKDSVVQFKKNNVDIKKGLKSFEADFSLPRF